VVTSNGQLLLGRQEKEAAKPGRLSPKMGGGVGGDYLVDNFDTRRVERGLQGNWVSSLVQGTKSIIQEKGKRDGQKSPRVNMKIPKYTNNFNSGDENLDGKIGAKGTNAYKKNTVENFPRGTAE